MCRVCEYKKCDYYVTFEVDLGNARKEIAVIVEQPPVLGTLVSGNYSL